MNTYHLKFTAGYILALLITQTLAQQVNMEEGSRGFCGRGSNPCAGIQTRGEVFVAVVSDLEKAGPPLQPPHAMPPPTHAHTTHFKHTRADTQRHFVYPATSSHRTHSNHPGSPCVFVIYLSPLYIFIKQPDCFTGLLPARLHFLCLSPLGSGKPY